MKKWIIFLLLVVLCPVNTSGSEKVHCFNTICPSNVKFSKKIAPKGTIVTSGNSKCYTVLPLIHQGFWPDFCLDHLQHDPEGCSAWGWGKKHSVDLELPLYGYSHAHIDRDLIARLGPLIDLIPCNNQGKRCDYAWCRSCRQRVIRGVCCVEDACAMEDAEDENDVEIHYYHYYVVYQCACTNGWWISTGCLNNKEIDIYESWQFCGAPTIYYGYLDWNNRLYFRHLKNLLLYEKENRECDCYWPQINLQAKEISDTAYTKLAGMFESFCADKVFEHYRPNFSIAQPIYAGSCPYPYNDRDGYGRTLHEMLAGVLTQSFFYTHYRDILLDFDQNSFKELPSYDYSAIHGKLLDIEEAIQPSFLQVYNQCLQKHPHPKIYYERGMVLFHRGENLDALEDIRKFISYVENNHYQDLLNSDLYLKEGKLLSESLSYDEAIVALTKAIEKDPENVDAYFERAIAYFETGDFSKALSDYLASGIQPKRVDPKKVGKLNDATFGQGIALGMIKGGEDSVTEFVPSLLSCFRGISRGIWACVSNPIAVSQDMIDCANACLEFIKDNTTKEMLCKIVPELQECLKKWDQLDDYSKGKYIGYVVGKYGVDIFMASGSVKAIQLYRNLRKANAVMTLETAAVSPKLAQEVLEQAVKQEKVRKTILESGNLKIHRDRQGKHIPGRHNYQPGKSIFEHPDPKKLVDEFAGTGKKYGSHHPGKPGYKEDIDFLELIGYAVDESTGMQTPTSWGRLHYAIDGIHIVPIRPRG